MRRAITCGGGGSYALHLAAAAMVMASAPLMVMEFRPCPDIGFGLRYPPFPVGGGRCRCRAWSPGKPRPHITRDRLGMGGFTVRVKGIRPKPWRLREFKPAAPNYKGSKYERLACAKQSS